MTRLTPDPGGVPVPRRTRLTEYLTIDAVRELVSDRSWVQQVFAAEELAPLADRRDPAPGLAARLAAKRGVLVALSGQPRPALEFEDRDELRSVQVLTFPGGAPTVRLSGRSTPDAAPVAISVSLSHDGGLAAALVVTEESPYGQALGRSDGNASGSDPAQ